MAYALACIGFHHCRCLRNMNLAEALAHVEDGGRATCDVLPQGAVLKREPRGWGLSGPRVVWEATGTGFDFRARSEHEAAEWRAVEGWASYD